MANIYTNIVQMVGKTPLMELTKIEEKYGLKSRILAKLEFFNPAGSIKDRVAVSMIEDAEQTGRLKPGGTIIEPTSGNTGIGVTAFGVNKGYRVIIVMPENMSEERKKLIRAFGGELVLTPKEAGVVGAINKAKELEQSIPGAIQAGQFVNLANPRTHTESTGPEIWEDADGQIDYFLAGVGTGGTLTGIGHYLKKKNKDIKVIALEPTGSAILSGGKDGPHVIEGIGDGLVPDVLDCLCYSEVMTVTDEASLARARELASLEGLLVGISSGCALDAAIRVAQRPEAEGKTIVIIFADGGYRYFSTELFEK